MAPILYWFFAICIAIFFLRHVATNYMEKEDREFYLKDWMTIIGMGFAYGLSTFTDVIWGWVSKFVFLDNYEKFKFLQTDYRMAKAFFISFLLILLLALIISFLNFIEEIKKGKLLCRRIYLQ